MHVSHIVLNCPCGFRTNEVPIGLVRSAEKTVFFAAYYRDGALVSVKYPLPSCVDIPECIKHSIARVLEQTHGNCILGETGEVDATCPNCSRDLKLVPTESKPLAPIPASIIDSV